MEQKVTLVWIYMGQNPAHRREVIGEIDGKLVNSMFPIDMAAPLGSADIDQKTRAGHSVRDRHQHYWDGNARAISRPIAESFAIEDMNLRDDSLLTLLSDIVDRDTLRSNGNLKLMLFPLERFAAIEATPLGLAS